MNRRIDIFFRYYQKHPGIISIAAAGVVLGIDYLTGKYVQFPIIYAIPCGLAAWKLSKRSAYALAIFLPIIRIVFHWPWKESFSASYLVANTTIRIVALLIYAYLIYRTAWQTNSLEKKVDVLEGILPICSFCKRIRNENGEYEQIEKYVGERSSASFSHGICQDCAKKMYPEFYKDKE